MKISFEILELIKRYVHGELNDEERTSLEQLIVENPELQEEVALAKMLVAETGNVEEERLMEVIRQAHSTDKESDAEKKINRSFLRRRFLWVAVAAGLAIVFYFLWGVMQASNQEKDQIAFKENAYIPPINNYSQRGTKSTIILGNAFQEFENENYEESLQLINTISDQDSSYLQAIHLAGHNYIKSGSYRRAKDLFTIAWGMNNPSKYFPTNLENIGWSLIYVQWLEYESDKTEAKEEALKQALLDFIKVAEPTDIYHKKATQLQKLLD